MEWLNYHHLLYFYLAAREGTITKAGNLLRLSQPTISGQIRSLEDALGEQLLDRSGRTLKLTDVGRVVYRYAEEIFSAGRELQDTLKQRPTGGAVRFRVGISDVVPKLVVHRLLEPALRIPDVRLICTEGKTDRLLAALAVQELDMVVTDAPMGHDIKVKAFNHLLGESGTTLFAHPDLTRDVDLPFPQVLQAVPVLLPTEGSVMRRGLDDWFEEQGLRPYVIAEFDDGALMKVFGESRGGIFPAPSVMESDICSRYGVQVMGRVESIRERFFAITVERRIKHPGVACIVENARRGLFPKRRKATRVPKPKLPARRAPKR